MLKSGVWVFVALVSVSSNGVAGVRDVRACLGRHVREAMELNERRAPFYEMLSQGRSREISRRLIAMEKKLAAVAPFADAAAMPFQMAGVPILCRDLVEMSEVPAMKGFHPEGADLEGLYVSPPLKNWETQLRHLFQQRAYQELARVADQQVRVLEAVPRYNCLVKHILESIRRVSVLTPQHKELAKTRIGVSSEFLSRSVLSNHIDLLEESGRIDQLAAPLQAEGLPIVCQDVPPIPWP